MQPSVNSLRVAVCQMRSGSDLNANLAFAGEQARAAAAQGAGLVCFPEYTPGYVEESGWLDLAKTHGFAVIGHFAALARETQCAISLGSVLLPTDDPARAANVSILFDADGSEVVRYQKRHLFDVNLPERTFRESDFLVPGGETVVADCRGWRFGFSICFDLRFSAHYLALRQKGAEVILVPSAFTARTGRDHWESLLRARAIETQCYLIAAAQTGECSPEKSCHGHSMIIDPWGRILADAGDEPGLVVAELEKAVLRETRAAIPMQQEGVDA